MHWLFALAALAAFITLAFREARSRRVLFATIAVLGILFAGTALFLALDTRLEEKRQRATRQVAPDEIAITDARLSKELGRWILSGTLANNSKHRVTTLTLHVTIRDCSDAAACSIAGETDATTSGIDVAPGQKGAFSMQLYLPDVDPPKVMKWDYEVRAIGSREG
ncbi:MAG: hypothetical protein D6773_07745 [Alphaproteobacteria bacterium]|nr:MAG: hypothetical protein D6773_07745 [Alphaproteobacteria bacterium]